MIEWKLWGARIHSCQMYWTIKVRILATGFPLVSIIPISKFTNTTDMICNCTLNKSSVRPECLDSDNGCLFHLQEYTNKQTKQTKQYKKTWRPSLWQQLSLSSPSAQLCQPSAACFKNPRSDLEYSRRMLFFWNRGLGGINIKVKTKYWDQWPPRLIYITWLVMRQSILTTRSLGTPPGPNF